MAGIKSKQELVLKFDWLQIVGYMIPSTMIFLRALALYYLRNPIPYFLFVYVVLPFIELGVPNYTKNHTKNEQRIREKDNRFLIPLYAMVLAYIVDIYCLYDFMTFAFQNFSYLSCIFTIYTVWLTAGMELIVAHELGHRKSCFHRFFGYLLYLRFLNTNYIITHNKGHHKWVATPLDPGSALKGQTVFQFAAHSTPHSYVQGWNIEVDRIKKKYGESVSNFYKVVLNQVLLMKLGEVVYLGIVTYIWGFKILCFALLHGALQHFGLEIINYVEHYGLRRKEIAPGKYEKVNVNHSWNSAQSFNNFIHLRLNRHSDHHQTGAKPYQALQNCEDSPQLPFSYTTAFTLALNSKLWFESIDPLVEIYQEEKRQPTEKEAKKSKDIATKAILISIVQNLVVAFFALIV